MNSDPRRAHCLGSVSKAASCRNGISQNVQEATGCSHCPTAPSSAQVTSHRRPLWVRGYLHLCFKVMAPGGAGTTGPKEAQGWGCQAAAQAQLAPARGLIDTRG